MGTPATLCKVAAASFLLQLVEVNKLFVNNIDGDVIAIVDTQLSFVHC